MEKEHKWESFPLVDVLWFGCPFCGNDIDNIYELKPVEHWSCNRCGVTAFHHAPDCRDISPTQSQWPQAQTLVVKQHPAKQQANELQLKAVRLASVLIIHIESQVIWIPRFYGDTATSISRALTEAMTRIGYQPQSFIVRIFGAENLTRHLILVNHNNVPGAQSVTLELSATITSGLFLPRDHESGEFIDFSAQRRCLTALSADSSMGPG